MKFGAILLCAMLPVGAQAVEQGAPLPVGESTAQPAQPQFKNDKTVRGKKTKPKSKSGAGKAVPKGQKKSNAVTETPAESMEQDFQIKGVRG
jgi:hypothetical protein